MFREFDALLTDHARCRPDAVFVESPDQAARITFGEFDRVTRRFARFLHDRGVGVGDRVSVLADNGIEALITFWGTLRAGAVVNSINVEIREKHIALILRRVQPRLVLWSLALGRDPRDWGQPDASWVPMGEWQAPGRAAGELFALLQDASDTVPDGPRARPEDLAVISYTSGTTDTPKGVLWTRDAYYAMSESSVDRLEITEADVILDYRHWSWSSPEILSIGPSMLTGARLVLARKFSQTRFFDWVREHGVTVAVGIPTVINMLLSRPAAVGAADVPTLRFITSSTAPLSPERQAEFEQRYGIPIVQLAGSTETGFMAGNHPARRRPGSIGRPTLNMTVRILDDAGRDCPPKQEGEMVVSGRQMASAYLTDVDTLVPIARDGFRTGDLAWRDEEGYLYISGRRKDIIIKGGVNIAASEITNVLLQHPGVAEAATLGVPDPIYGEAVAGFVTPRPGVTLDGAQVTDHCRARLAEFKVPAAVVVLDTIPKNANGKVARDRLAALWEQRDAR